MDEWERARRRQDQLREQIPKNQARLRRLNEQTLAPGWTWNQVLSWHGFSYSAALAYWDECRRLEREYPGFRYWEPQPNNPMTWPTQPQTVHPNDEQGYFTHDGTGYYYVVGDQHYPMPDHPDNYNSGGPLGSPPGGHGVPFGHQQQPAGQSPVTPPPPGGRIRAGRDREAAE
ncbi:MAG: hypothetical protein M3548_19945 [Actinomycetota bacterium]|nr:hypothetical protein [Actinomycetota bacterium]